MRTKPTPGVSDYDKNMNLKEPERFTFRDVRRVKYERTRNGAAVRTDWGNGYAVDVRGYVDDPENVWVFINCPDGENIGEKVPKDQVDSFIARHTGKR
jgi:hypothetical protein